MSSKQVAKNRPIRDIHYRQFFFIDLFAGCGGLSLGLQNSGWEGIFAIEKSPQAFKTLRHNLVDSGSHNQGKARFNWPDWLEIAPYGIRSFMKEHRPHLRRLVGHVQLVAGGPPCQGFSYAGKRTGRDPRNELFKLHMEMVDMIKPPFVLLENVPGIDTVFGVIKKRRRGRGRPKKSYAERIKTSLAKNGYDVQQKLVKATDYGVPQFRPRYFTIGIRRDLLYGRECPDYFDILQRIRKGFLKSKGLPLNRPVTVAEAISDLEVSSKKTIACNDPESPTGYREIVYQGPVTSFQRLMHRGMNRQKINSLRLVNHRPETVARFRHILMNCRKGVQLSRDERKGLGITKKAIAPLSPDKPSHTLTTLPDDLLHYAEPRIHTVREYARLQSFPDWFEFRSKYTTGGARRIRECPRYTQVGNAVPPLLAEAFGRALIELASILGRKEGQPSSNKESNLGN